MAADQIFLLVLLVSILILFAWGRWRYDIIAFVALIVATLAGTVPTGEMFSGFGHPATVTVALVLVISRGLRNSGAVTLIARHVLVPQQSPVRQVGLYAGVGALLSTVMNNVGALALLMPAALQSAGKAGHPPSRILMPLSFATILGGMVTLIGTPPNIIVATYRNGVAGAPFAMFDFTPVGATVAVAGVLYVALIGWRLLPKAREGKESPGELFKIEDYVSEAVVPQNSKSSGRSLCELDKNAAEHDGVILRLFRNRRRIDRPDRQQDVLAGDVLAIEAGPKALNGLLSALDLKLTHGKGKNGKEGPLFGGADTVIMEAVVQPRSPVEGRTPAALQLRRRFGINLIGISRRGRPFGGRLSSFRLEAGDVLLLEGDPERVHPVVSTLGCLPLASRGLVITDHRQALFSIGIFAGAIAAATLGLVSITVALAVVVAAFVMLNVVPPRDLYGSVDWPVVVLLAALIPVGDALSATGTTTVVVGAFLAMQAGWPPVMVLITVLILTMMLTDVINNAATAVVMAPLAIATAAGLGVSADPFLMAVAVGSSCAFLTPIGHQNNTLILGAGGYAFGDYWRMGLPLEILIVLIAVPMILWVWPL
jgi:di/tricarboxylate transporter